MAGILTIFGFLGSFTIGLPFLVAGLLMCAFGFVRYGVGDAWRRKGGVRWLAVVVGAVVPIFASLALTDTSICSTSSRANHSAPPSIEMMGDPRR